MVIFWFSMIMLVYIYAGYPAYVYTRAKVAGKKTLKDMGYTPSITVVFSAHNEEGRIIKKIENLLASDYPAGKLEILVGSDGSTDGTAKVLEGLSNYLVKPFIFPERRGKVNVLNELVPQAKGEIIVFCDTRQIFGKDAIRNLASNFADKSVGCVSGELVFERDENSTGVSTGVGVYLNYEKMIRLSESRIHSMVGATGAIYAIRKELYAPPPGNTILDDVYIPLSIAKRGFRCIVDEGAKAYDKPALESNLEFNRKIRTLAGNYQIFAMFKDLFKPVKNPVFMPLFSHKFLRVLAPFFMILLLIGNLDIATVSPFFKTTLFAQIFFYAMAFTGLILEKWGQSPSGTVPIFIIFGKLASTAYMFCMMNVAAVAGLYRYIRGTQLVTWEN